LLPGRDSAVTGGPVQGKAAFRRADAMYFALHKMPQNGKIAGNSRLL